MVLWQLMRVACLAALFMFIGGSHALASADSEPHEAGRQLNSFGLRLMEELDEKGSNVILSPYSIAIALSMAEEGAVGDTATQIRTVLGFSERSATSLSRLSNAFEASQQKAAALQNATPNLAEHQEPISLKTANRLFADAKFPLSAAYLQSMAQMFKAVPESLPFRSDPEAARTSINDWAEQQTARRIVDLIPEGGVTVDTVLVLVNALFFKAAWLSGFDPSETKPHPFTLSNNEIVEVPMLHGRKQARYQVQEDFRALSLSYVGSEFELIVLLPKEGASLDDFLPRITGDLLATVSMGAKQAVEITLPKLAMRSPSLKLSDALQELGMTAAFDKPPGAADFSPMFEPGAPRTRVEEVYHKTFFLLDEEGSEAAAATAVIIGRLAMPSPSEGPIRFVVDRPFLFAIRHCPSGAALFLGKISDPRG